jgi:glycosyltransferase involved in cell wall biosynthesis
VEAGRFAFGPWLARHGIAAEAHAEVPPLPNAELGAVVRLADVAVFPNRCEGGTNLVAMECMAAGVPVLLSDTTGHRDLLDPGRTMPLPTRPLHAGAPAYAAWGEVPVPALVEALEVARQERAAAHARAAAAAAWMRHVDWARQMDRVMELVADAADTRTYPADLRRAGGC